jgi:DNA-binding transcriptional regulator YdaS (Cro superfamily)
MEAIRAAGGVGQLARQIGISQPSVSNWTRVPAERVISVEAARGSTAPCCGRISTVG